MSKHEELIDRLRRQSAELADTGRTLDYSAAADAADALEAQAREIADMQQQESELCTLHAMAEAECKKLRAEIEGLRKDAEELKFLESDLMYWVERAVDKGNANSDIEEAFERYRAWWRARQEIQP